MAPVDRILQKLRSGATELSFREVTTLLEGMGWTMSEGAKHHKAKSPRGNTIMLPRKPRIVSFYLKQLLKEIDRSGGE